MGAMESCGLKDGDPIAFMCGRCGWIAKEIPEKCGRCGGDHANAAMQPDPTKRPTFINAVRPGTIEGTNGEIIGGAMLAGPGKFDG